MPSAQCLLPGAPILILGIESSCDETAAAVVESGVFVRSSVVASQHALHEEYAGVVPEIASRAHVEAIIPVIREALAQAGLGLGMIDAIAVGHRPGLIGSLLVGVAAAKSLAWSLGKPLIGVDHVEAHLYSGMLREEGEQEGKQAGRQAGRQGEDDVPLFPALGLVVSGGHTAMYHLDSWDSISRIGSTIDDALGEAYDKAATIMGIPYPGGPNLDRLAQQPGARDTAFDLPISRLSPTSLDFSFSGLKTAVLYTVRGVPGERAKPGAPVTRGPLDMSPDNTRDLAASFQKTASRAITLKLDRAIEQAAQQGRHYRTLLAGGGVTLNSRLRAELTKLAAARSLTLRLPAPPYCMDNAAMIAGLAHEHHQAGRTDTLALQAMPTASR